MKLVDVNILLYAVNQNAPEHVRALSWWQDVLQNDEEIGLAWTVVLGFVRVSTNPRIFAVPLKTDEVISHVDAWLGRANVRIVTELEGHWDHLRSFLQQIGTAGNLTTDAHLAALAISHGATLASSDTDFARFTGLRWENPLSVA
jgi:toxin-antitoxin system PIN domain toxin